MNDLLKKGILGVAEAGITTEEGRNCTSRTWFVNPNILCCGPKDKIDRATRQIFRRSLKNFTVGDTKKKTQTTNLFILEMLLHFFFFIFFTFFRC